MDVTLDDALAWIPKAERMGFYEDPTPRLLRTAAEMLKSILDKDEKPTLAYINQIKDQLINRLLRRKDVTPSTSKTYIQRASKLLSDFESWSKNPSSFQAKPIRKRETSPEDSASRGTEKPPTKRQDSESGSFKLPGSSYEELTKIIKGYLAIGTEAAPPDIASVTGQAPAEISRNSGFLVSIGVLEGNGSKHLTQAGRNLALALQHEMPDDIASNWRAVVGPNEFLQRIVSAVRIRRAMDETTLRSHIAYTAGQSKNPKVMAGAGAVIDVLHAAGLLRVESGKLVPAEDAPSIEQAVKHNAPQKAVLPLSVPAISASGGGYSITINVQIACTPSDLPSLASGLRKLMQDLAAPHEESREEEGSGAAITEDNHPQSA